MPITKLVGRQVQGTAASTDPLDYIVQISLANTASLTQGQPLSIDATRIPNIQGTLSVFQTPNPTLSSYLQTAPRANGLTTQVANLDVIETVVLPTSANAGPLLGVYQGPTFTNNTGTSAFFPIVCRQWGYGLVLAGAAAAGTAVKVGSMLNYSAFPSASQAFALAVAANAAQIQGLFVGVATAYLIQYTATAAIAAGAGQVVTPVLPTGTNGMAGITTTQAVLVDTLASNVQETVTPSAVTATTFTATFANAHAINTPLVGASTAFGNTVIAVPGAGTATAIIQAFINC